MNKEQYIKSRFRSILSETINERMKEIETDIYDVTPFHKAGGSFDYVQEGKETCNECGGMMKEGECKECGWKGDKEVMESGLKKLEKISSKEIEDLLGDIDSDLKKSTNKRKKHNDTEEVEIELELDESWYSHDEYERMRDFGTEDELQAYQDKLVSGGKKEKAKKEGDTEEIEFELELDEEECKECGPSSYEMKEKLYGKQTKLDKNKNGKIDKEDFKMLRKQQDEETLYEVEFEKEMEEGETEEGNAFTGMLKKTPKGHSFKLGGKEYKDRSSLEEKWNKEVDVKQTGEYSDMSIEELNAAIKKQKAKNDKTMESGKKVSHADKTKMSQLYFAKRAKQGWKGRDKAKVTESILYTESDLIDLIERLVVEEKKKFKTSEPKGYREYEKAHKADKKENDDYLKSLAKKMTDYLKPVSDEGSKYEMKETKKFPTENGGLKKGIRKKYTPSDAVDDYNDAFSYPGQTNLRYEIKPNDEWMEANLVGSSKTGNAQVDEDGNALGNVVPSEVGEKFLDNYKNNYYADEQAEASYKRQVQPIEQAGEHTESGSLKSKKGKKTAQSILNKVDESIEPKKIEKLNEEYNRIQELMGYNRKTQ